MFFDFHFEMKIKMWKLITNLKLSRANYFLQVHEIFWTEKNKYNFESICWTCENNLFLVIFRHELAIWISSANTNSGMLRLRRSCNFHWMRDQCSQNMIMTSNHWTNDYLMYDLEMECTAVAQLERKSSENCCRLRLIENDIWNASKPDQFFGATGYGQFYCL